MKINLIRYSNSLNPLAPYKKDSEQFLEDVNNELFDDDLELAENVPDPVWSIVFIETGGSEQKFIKDIDNYLVGPVILLSNCKNNSLPACFEIRTYLASKKIEAVVIFGDEKDVASTIKQLHKIYYSLYKMRNINLGVIGVPSDWLIASRVDYADAKKYFGVNLIDITSSELKQEIDKGIDGKIPHLAELKKKNVSNDVLEGALKIYCGLKRIINKYNLKGFTLRCFDLIDEYKNTSCLAFALLNEEGIIATCEGDVPALLSMSFIKATCDLPSFQANPSKIDIRNSEIILAHCTLPLNMCKKYELHTHFESGLGIGVRGEMEKGQVTIFKIAPDLKHVLCINGTINDNLTLPNYCRTQINIKLEKEALFELIKENFGNHVLVIYGDVSENLLSVYSFIADRFNPNDEDA